MNKLTKITIFILGVSSFLFCSSLYSQELEVTVIPQGIIEKIELVTEISISFNKPMVPIGEIKKEIQPDFLTITPQIKGKFYWAGDRTLIFHPEERLPFSTSFKIKIKKGARSLTGEVLKKDLIFTFETPSPSIIQSQPYENSVIPRKGKVLLTFNQPVSLEEIKSKIKFQILPSIYTLPMGYKTSSIDALNKISKNLKILPSRERTFLEVKAEYDKDSLKRVFISPVSPLPLNSQVKIIVPRGFKGKEGDLGSKKDFILNYLTPKTLLYGGISCFECDPYSSISITFSNTVDPREAIKNLKIYDMTEEKEVELKEEEDYRYSYRDTEVYLSSFFNFKAGHNYRLEILKTLKDVYGHCLGYSIVENFSLRDYPFSVDLINRWGVIESKGPKVLSLRLINVDSIRREIIEIKDEEIGKFLSYLKTNEPFFLNDSSQKLKLKSAKNVSTIINIDLKEILGKEEGIIYTEIVAEEVKPGSSYRTEGKFVNGILQITDIGVSVKCSPTNILIYTTSLSTGKSLSQCEIKLFDTKGKLLWKGETDENGLCLAPGIEDLGIKDTWDDNFIVLARKGNDRSFITEEWDYGIEGWDFDIDMDWDVNKKRTMGYIFTERGAYRPGEDVYVKAIFRIKEMEKFSIPSDKEIEFKILDSRNKEILTKKETLNKYGSGSFSFKIPEESPTGYYEIQTKGPKELGIEDKDRSFYCSFLVSEYRKPDFRVDVSVKKENYLPDEKMETTIKGTYLYGAPMKNSKVKWTLRREPTSFSPPLKGELSRKNYVFEDWTKEDERWGSEVVASGEDILSTNGELFVRQKLSYSPRPMRYLFEGEIIDITEQAISNRASFLLHPSDFYLGIEYSSYFVEKGRTYKTSIIAVDREGNILKGKKVKIELIKREWHSVQEKEEGTYYRYKSEPVDIPIKSLVINTFEKPCEVEFPMESGGYFILKAYTKDEKGHDLTSGMSFYCIGEGFTAWERYDHNRIDLVPEKNELRPGELARVLVKSPWEESKGIVCIEREGIMEYFPITLKGSNQVLQIPIKKDYIPTIYVSVLLIKGRTSEKLKEGVDVGKPTFRLGYAKLNVLPEELYLKVELNTEKEEFRPREKVKVQVKVSDREGKGKKAEVTLYAVDFGVLSLTGYKVPDLITYFYKERFLGVKNSETRVVLISREYLEGKLASAVGGGGFDEAMFQIRADFRVTPFWRGEILTDENGYASDSFELPDSLTTFVIMAVAQTLDSHFGSSKKEIRVSKPLMLFPALPRFLIIGDRFEGAIRIQNNTKEKGELLIRVKSLSERIKIKKEEESTALLPEGTSLLRFPMEAISSGKAKIQFFAVFKTNSKEERDAVEVSIPIKIPKLRIDSATFGSADKKETLKISIPDNIYKDEGGLRITLSSSALSDLEKGAEFLLEYPYGCTEQLTSMLTPFIALHNLSGAFKFKNFEKSEIEKIISQTLSKIYKNQKSDGGFGFWSDSRDSFPYLSSYVLFIFKMAEKRGIKIDKNVREKLIKYLDNILKGKIKCEYGVDLITKAFALYSLSLYGKHDESYHTLLYERRGSLPLFSKAFLLSSISRTKKQSPMKETILREIMNKARLEPSMAHFEEPSFYEEAVYMHSTLRTNAIILMALLDADPDSSIIEKLVVYILSKRKNGIWRNTQENSYALLSLSEYFIRKEGKEIDFHFQGKLDGKNLNSIRFTELKKEIISIAMEELQTLKRKLTLILEKSGKGKLFWGAILSFYPKGTDFPELNQGFAVKREFEDLNTGEKKTTFKLGDLIRVRIKVHVTAERNYAAIVDPIPAGTEIENSYLKTTSLEAQRKLGNISWYFNHVEGYDDRMQIFADTLPQGEHEFFYIIRATTKGTFLVPSTKVEEMYNPEVFGTTKGEIVRIE